MTGRPGSISCRSFDAQHLPTRPCEGDALRPGMSPSSLVNNSVPSARATCEAGVLRGVFTWVHGRLAADAETLPSLA
jgi:hypothetical protein